MEDNKYKVIVTDDKGKVKVWKQYLIYYFIHWKFSNFIFKDDEIKRVIDLLKDESSALLSILQDLTIFLKESLFFNFKKKEEGDSIFSFK